MDAAATTTYINLYRGRDDPLQGDYVAWVGGHAVADGNTPASVRDLMLGTPNSVPKVYLVLVTGTGGEPVVKTVFRPQLYPSLPGVVTPWNDCVFAFGTDLGPGNQITTVAFPADAFHLAAAVWAPDTASMADAWGAAPDARTLGPFIPNAPNTVLTRTRGLMVVPQPYVPLVLGATLTPREAWARVSTAIFNDNRVVSCAALLDWLRVATTVQPGVNGDAPVSPVLRAALVAPLPDHALAQHRWDLVLMDLPQLAALTRTHDQALLFAVAALQQSNTQQAAATLLDRSEARAPKLPSHKFPATVTTLQRVVGAATEQTLPTFWHDMANCAKSEYRLVLVAAFAARAMTPTASTPTPPPVTKEILECFTQQKLVSSNPDDLEDGLQLYRFVPGPEEHDRDTMVRNNLYDLMQAGDAAPSVSDLRSLASTKIFIPCDYYEVTTALQRHSLALDVYLGPTHPVCVYYRTWITAGWSRIESQVRQFIAQCYPGHSATAYARFARWISLRMNSYLGRLTDLGVDAMLPNLYQFGDLIMNRENTFPPIPERYLVTPTPPRPLPTPVRTPGPLPGPAPVLPVDDSDRRTRDPNPRPIQAVVQAFLATGMRIKACYGINPPPNGQYGPICLTFHATDGCFKRCGKVRSHKPLSSADQEKLITYCGACAAAGGPAE
jgi:hypothetical protein